MIDSNAHIRRGGPKRLDIGAFIGLRFGRFVVLSFIRRNVRHEPIMEVRCDCGRVREANLLALRSGETKSCGCLLREMLLLPTPLRQKTPGRIRKRPERIAKRASQEKWKANNKNKSAAMAKRFRERHKEQVRAEKAAWYQVAKPRIIAKLNHRFATDLRFRIEATLRSRIRKVLKRQNAVKSCKLPKLLGCSLDEFKAYIASRFTEGMTWDKFMAGEIHIDHVKPCRAFNLLDPAEQAKCFHFTNHQPLWSSDNLRKSDLLPDGSRAREIMHAQLAPA
jgi:hypothetical protein